MDLAKSVAVLALLLATLLIAGYAGAGDKKAVEGPAAREAARRTALAEHERRKAEVQQRCVKRIMTHAELEACRVAYRRL